MFEELKESPWLRHTEPGEVVTMRSRGGIWMWVFFLLKYNQKAIKGFEERNDML